MHFIAPSSSFSAALALAVLAPLAACSTDAHSRPDSDYAMSMGSARSSTFANDSSQRLIRQAELEGEFIVPPDRARLEVSVVTFIEGTRAVATSTLGDWVKRFTASVDNVPGCRAQVMEIGVASHTKETAQQHATVIVEVALQGLETVAARSQKVNACASVVDDQLLEGRPRSKLRSYGTFANKAGVWELTVDNPRTHLPTLMERASARLEPLANMQLAPQMRPLDRRCVPTGEVLVRAAAFAGVWLVPELLCDVVAPARFGAENHAP